MKRQRSVRHHQLRRARRNQHRVHGARFEALEGRLLLAAVLDALKTDQIAVDVYQDGQFDPGDTIEYNVQIHNPGEDDALDVLFEDLLDPNTILTGPINVSPLAMDDQF